MSLSLRFFGRNLDKLPLLLIASSHHVVIRLIADWRGTDGGEVHFPCRFLSGPILKAQARDTRLFHSLVGDELLKALDPIEELWT